MQRGCTTLIYLNPTPNTEPAQSGHSYKLNKTRCKTAKYQNFYQNRITDTWNGLPTKVVDAETVNKNRIDAHWKHHPLRYNPRAGVKRMPERYGGDYVAH